MGLDQHVGDGGLAGQIRTFALAARVLVVADIVPGPAIEAVLANPGDIVGRQVVAEQVPLVGGAPDVLGRRMDRQADAVADAGGVDLLIMGYEAIKSPRAVKLSAAQQS